MAVSEHELAHAKRRCRTYVEQRTAHRRTCQERQIVPRVIGDRARGVGPFALHELQARVARSAVRVRDYETRAAPHDAGAGAAVVPHFDDGAADAILE